MSTEDLDTGMNLKIYGKGIFKFSVEDATNLNIIKRLWLESLLHIIKYRAWNISNNYELIYPFNEAP